MKRYYFLLLCCLASTVMAAAPITLDEARQKAEQFLNRKASARRTASAARDGSFVATRDGSLVATKEPSLPSLRVRLAYGNDADGQPQAYAFNVGANGGFVLVSASDQGDGIIGYSDHGSFDPQQMPNNMRLWLDSYTKAISQVDLSVARQRSRAAAAPTKMPVRPLLTTQWSQDSPYSDLCPEFKGKHAPTGCTITAMAQIMYYHRWPEGETKPIPYYTPSIYDEVADYSMPELSPTVFDWTRMYPSYKNKEDGTEVARLMQYLGSGAKAFYGEAATNATGYEALRAMQEYFGYDAGGHCLHRRRFSYSDWVDTLYTELQAQRPVMFSGKGLMGGHSFVVDGYDEEDFFHVNWGWGGMSDGYYRVVLLDPEEQGIGGTDYEAYTVNQVAFIGIRPDTGKGTLMADRLTLFYLYLRDYTDNDSDGRDARDGSLVATKEPSLVATKEPSLRMQGEYDYAEGIGYHLPIGLKTVNLSSVKGLFDMGCRLLKDDGTVSKDYEWAVRQFYFESSMDVGADETFCLDPQQDPTLTDGDYRLYFVSRPKGQTVWQLDDDWDKFYLTLHLDHAHRKLTVKAVVPEVSLKAQSVTFETTPVKDKRFYANVTLTNNGSTPYHGDIAISVSDDEKSMEIGYTTCDIEVGEQKTLRIACVTQAVGQKILSVFDWMGYVLYNGSITIGDSKISEDVALTFDSKITNAEGTEIVGNKALVDVTITNNTDTDFEGAIYMEAFISKDGKEYEDLVTNKEFIEAGQSVVRHYKSPELNFGEKYTFRVSYDKGKERVTSDVTPGVAYTMVPHYVVYDAMGNATALRQTSDIKPTAAQCAIDLLYTEGDVNVDTKACPNLLVYARQDSRMTGKNVIREGVAEDVELTDGYPFFCPFPFTARHISFARTQEQAAGLSTLVLPFAPTSITAPTGVSVQVLGFYYEDGNRMEFYPIVSDMADNVPYLMAVTADGTDHAKGPIAFTADNAYVGTDKAVVTGSAYKMVGTTAGVTDQAVYTLNADGTAFVSGTASVKPFHAYFQTIGSATGASQLDIVLRGTTAISTVGNQPTSDSVCYNLSGQRVSKPRRGIYIIGGRKVIK